MVRQDRRKFPGALGLRGDYWMVGRTLLFISLVGNPYWRALLGTFGS